MQLPPETYGFTVIVHELINVYAIVLREQKNN